MKMKFRFFLTLADVEIEEEIEVDVPETDDIWEARHAVEVEFEEWRMKHLTEGWEVTEKDKALWDSLFTEGGPIHG